ncbi:MAG: hypothetical protein WDN26_05780 [Chitinophagaceae bacterium]
MKWNEEASETGACYFNTFNTVDCVDVFVRPVYKQVVIHTLNHFIDSGKLVVYGWCLMSNHLHLLSKPSQCSMAEVEKEFKSFTTTKILEAMDTEPEVKRQWMLERFENFGNILGFIKKFHVWQTCSNPLYIDFKKAETLIEHFEFIHGNPVRDKIVDVPGEYLYSSARDYSGIKGIVNIQKLLPIEKYLSAAESMNGNFFVKYIRN